MTRSGDMAIIPPVILIVDNYDSFTYNLVQVVGEWNRAVETKVVLNDQVSVRDVEDLNPSQIIISPGPCTPSDAGISIDIVRHFAGRIPMLGVCLGHQCIAEVFGLPVRRAPRLMHGKISLIHHCGSGIYEGLPNPFPAARYHSLIVDDSNLPRGFERTAWTSRDESMGIRNAAMRLEGVQFHPESFLTPEGMRLLLNFLNGHDPFPLAAAARESGTRPPLSEALPLAHNRLFGRA